MTLDSTCFYKLHHILPGREGEKNKNESSLLSFLSFYLLSRWKRKIFPYAHINMHNKIIHDKKSFSSMTNLLVIWHQHFITGQQKIFFNFDPPIINHIYKSLFFFLFFCFFLMKYKIKNNKKNKIKLKNMNKKNNKWIRVLSFIRIYINKNLELF